MTEDTIKEVVEDVVDNKDNVVKAAIEGAEEQNREAEEYADEPEPDMDNDPIHQYANGSKLMAIMQKNLREIGERAIPMVEELGGSVAFPFGTVEVIEHVTYTYSERVKALRQQLKDAYAEEEGDGTAKRVAVARIAYIPLPAADIETAELTEEAKTNK